MKCKICDLEIPEDFKCKIPKYDKMVNQLYLIMYIQDVENFGLN